MPFVKAGGLLLAAIALLLGAGFLWKALRARRLATVAAARDVFAYSIVYLFVLFLGMIADALWRIPLRT
jgi:heme O synthase-like polyprenyltransferase